MELFVLFRRLPLNKVFLLEDSVGHAGNASRKKIMNFRGLILVSSLSVSLSFPVFATQFYVHKDMSGQTHILDYVTNEATKYGYSVVNDQGVTLQEVPSIASQERKARELKQAGDTRRSWEALRERKRKLLNRFTSLADIREIGNKKILALQNQIDTTVTYIEFFERNLEELETQALASKPNQSPASIKDLEAIESAKENIRKNQKYVEQRRDEQHKVRDEFLVLIDEYKELTGTKE